MRRLERAFWDGHSRNWDDSLVDAAVVAHVDELVAWLRSVLPSRAVVADLGCGTGNHAAALGAVGIDGSPGMLARARRKGVAVARADLGAALPLRTHGLDGALSVYAAQFLDLPAFLAEIHRVVRPGGVVLLEVPKPDRTGTSGLAGCSRRYRWFQRGKAVAAGVGRAVGRVRLHAEAELTAAVTAAGFAVVGARPTTHSTVVLARRP